MAKRNNSTESHHNAFPCQLPNRPGFFTGWILKLFFKGITINTTQAQKLTDLNRRGIVVYTTKYKSRFEFLFFYTRLRDMGLPFPEIGFDYRIIMFQPVSRLFRICRNYAGHFIRHFRLPDPYGSGFIRDELIGGRTALLSLIEKGGFYRRFVRSKTDPIRYLIETQQRYGRPVFLVPTILFLGRKPNREATSLTDVLFGTEERPKRIRRVVTLFHKPGKVFAEFFSPVNLAEMLERPEYRDASIEDQSRALRRELVRQTNRHRQSITGPVLKTKEELKYSILTGDRLQTFMREHAETEELPQATVHRKAIAYLDEIMAKYSLLVIRTGEIIIRWFIKLMFEGVAYNEQELERVKAASQRAPLILIPCHKSHIDYLILSYILFINNMPCPLIAAGKNLSFWPLGPFFRGGGAFFIRRTFKGAALYSKVFSEYIYLLLKEGFNIEFFIEGGRSRTGKLILPKIGLLSILLKAYRDGACDDLEFIPIFIGYDRVLEENAYLHEVEGGQKRPENLREVIRARKFLKKRYGRIYLNFHEPMSLNDILYRSGVRLEELESDDFNAFSRNLGHRIINAINTVSVVTPYALVASAILNRPKPNFSYTELMDNIETYLAFLSSQQAKLTDTLILDPVRAAEQVLSDYIHQKYIERIDEGRGSILSDAHFSVNESKRPLLEYYKNSSISFFVPAAFTALTILSLDAFQFATTDLHDGYRFLRDLFKNEFAYDAENPPEFYLRKTLKIFIDDAFLMPHPTLPDRYNLTSAGFRKLKRFARFIKPYFEAYWVVLRHFEDYPDNTLSPKDRLKKIQSSGTRMYKKKEIELKESLSKIYFSNAIGYYLNSGITEADDPEQIKPYADAIRKYLDLLT